MTDIADTNKAIKYLVDHKVFSSRPKAEKFVEFFAEHTDSISTADLEIALQRQTNTIYSYMVATSAVVLAAMAFLLALFAWLAPMAA